MTSLRDSLSINRTFAYCGILTVSVTKITALLFGALPSRVWVGGPGIRSKPVGVSGAKRSREGPEGYVDGIKGRSAKKPRDLNSISRLGLGGEVGKSLAA